MTTRPNILLIFSDQQQARAMSCAGHPDLQTPHLDRLAAAGVRFTRAYTPFPLCCPARSSLFSGKMPSEIGAMSNGAGIPQDRLPLTLGRLLSDAGYDCGYAGKWHAPEISPTPASGFETLCGMDDNVITEHCLEFVRRERQEPFFLVASYDNPHNICQHGRDQNLPWGAVPEAAPDEWPNIPLNHGVPAEEPEVIDRVGRAMPNMAHRGRFSPERWRLYRHVYFRLIEKVDRDIGELLDGLDAEGRPDNTLVIFLSDHGDMGGSHDLGQKSFLYEEAVHVPLILRWPGQLPAGETRQPFATIGPDLFATIADAAGVTQPDDVEGRSLLPLARDEEVEWSDQILVQTNLVQGQPMVGAQGRMIRVGRYKYSLYDWAQHREQLVDLEADPGEMVNLAVEKRHRETLLDMRRRLRTWCDTHGDGFSRAIPAN